MRIIVAQERKKVGHTIAIWLVEKSANIWNVTVNKILKLDLNTCIAGALKDHVVLILYWIRALFIRIEAVKVLGRNQVFVTLYEHMGQVLSCLSVLSQ